MTTVPACLFSPSPDLLQTTPRRRQNGIHIPQIGWLDKVMVEMGAGTLPVRIVRIPGESDNRQAREDRICPQLLGNPEPIHLRHPQVEKQDVRKESATIGQGLLPVIAEANLVALHSQDDAQGIRSVMVVIDYQDAHA